MPSNPEPQRRAAEDRNGEDERVKIDAPFEDVMRALLRTPPESDAKRDDEREVTSRSPATGS